MNFEQFVKEVKDYGFKKYPYIKVVYSEKYRLLYDYCNGTLMFRFKVTDDDLNPYFVEKLISENVSLDSMLKIIKALKESEI